MISGMALALQMAQQRQSRRRAWVFFPMLIAFGIIIGVAVYSVVSPYTIKQAPPAPGRHGALVWGDGIFANQAQLKAWLKIHGASYRVWRKTHPAALALVKPRKHHAVPARAKPPAKPAPAARSAAAPAAAVATPVSTRAASGTTAGWVRWFFTGLGLLLALCAIGLPGRIVSRFVTRPLQSAREIRLAVAGAAIAVLGGVAVATLLG
jgi:hypothetical protein